MEDKQIQELALKIEKLADEYTHIPISSLGLADEIAVLLKSALQNTWVKCEDALPAPSEVNDEVSVDVLIEVEGEDWEAYYLYSEHTWYVDDDPYYNVVRWKHKPDTDN